MSKKTDAPAALTCALIGVVIAALPHALARLEAGSSAFVADNDERFYLAVASQAYFNHPGKLADPVRAEGGPSLYRNLPLLPGIWAAKALGLGPLGIGLAWRVLSGLSIGLAWYLLLRRRVGRPWVAAGFAAILLADGGLILGQPIVTQAARVARIALGRGAEFFTAAPQLHREWRISTPALTMAYLILLIWSVDRAREAPTRGRIALAGACFGLLFYVYFYYWTAAGLALLIALAIDAGHRRAYVFTGVVGTLIGLPAVLADALLKRGTPPDWLPRTDKFLPIGHFRELLIPKGGLLILAALLAWSLARRRDLLFVLALAASGIMLSNQQILTGLQLENFHWSYVWNPAVALAIVLAAAAAVEARGGWSARPRLALAALATLMVGSGLWLRALEARRTHDTIQSRAALADYRADRPPGLAPPLEPNAVVAGDPAFVDFAMILDNLRPLTSYCAVLSPTVTDAELRDRIALDAILRGQDRPAFEAIRRDAIDDLRWGPASRDRDHSLRPAILLADLLAYDRIRADLPAALDRFAVRYVALPLGTRPAYLDRGWSVVEAGPRRILFGRDPSRAAGPGRPRPD